MVWNYRKTVMTHKVKIKTWVEKDTLFGGKKKVLMEQWIEVDDETYEQMKAEGKIDPMEVEDIVLMDWFLK